MTEYTQRELRNVTRLALQRLADDRHADADIRYRALAARAKLVSQGREPGAPDTPDIFREQIQPGLWVALDASHCIVIETRTADESELIGRVALSQGDRVTEAIGNARMARAIAEEQAGAERRAESIAAALAGGPKDSTDDYPPNCYEVHAGIRPPSRTRGKVRAVVFEKVPGGGVDIFTCAHDHAPGVHRCQDISPDQLAEVIRCGRMWTENQIARHQRPALPIVWERT